MQKTCKIDYLKIYVIWFREHRDQQYNISPLRQKLVPYDRDSRLSVKI